MKYKKLLWVFIVTGFLFGLLFGIGFDISRMKGQAMEQSIQDGEWLLVAKFKYGIKIPFAEKLIFAQNQPGNGQIIAFHYPKIYDRKISQKPNMVSRCIGQPGDTLQIINKEIFINREAVTKFPSVQFKYRLYSNEGELNQEFFQEYGIAQGGKVNEVGLYDFPLTRNQAEKLGQDERVSGLRILRGKPSDMADIFPVSSYYAFSSDNFGPVKIPQKGWTVPLNIRNIDLYKQIIKEYEVNSLELISGKVFINGEETVSYTFKQNYFFVLDDNRDYADDSRFWGFLPADHLIGAVVGF
ncbi:MAG: signal peptidase I [Bacteroidales bacterium]|nr:signal peptidase I [Bacteroidales bacterium]MCF8454759.1 signal peptidase I [Bacteroidales bacterium]